MNNYRYKKALKSKTTFSIETKKLVRIKYKRMLTSLISVILILATTVALTLAAQTDHTQMIINVFNAPTLVTNIEETFDNVTKTNVTATNSADSDMDVYVRLKFVVQTLDVETGDIIATPSSFGDDGYLLNLPITIVNAFNIGGLNVDFTGNGVADWFTDADESTGIYFYKYSLSPGESAYDLITEITQEVFYEDTIVRLTVLVDSIQVDGVEDAWGNVNQSEDYTDANGNPILYSSTYEEGATGLEPTADYDDYTQRFSSNYSTTQGIDSYGNDLTMKFSTE